MPQLQNLGVLGISHPYLKNTLSRNSTLFKEYDSLASGRAVKQAPGSWRCCRDLCAAWSSLLMIWLNSIFNCVNCLVVLMSVQTFSVTGEPTDRQKEKDKFKGFI